MADKPSYRAFRGARPLADIVGSALAPACRKRGFATVDLIAHWPDIVGAAYAETTQPDKLSWTKKPKGMIDADEHEPATLTVRCTGAAALRLTHELPLVVERINMFFGFRCVGRIRLVQLPVVRIERRKRPEPGPVSPDAARAIKAVADGFQDDGLRAAVERLGLAIAAGKRAGITKS